MSHNSDRWTKPSTRLPSRFSSLTTVSLSRRSRIWMRWNSLFVCIPPPPFPPSHTPDPEQIRGTNFTCRFHKRRKRCTSQRNQSCMPCSWVLVIIWRTRLSGRVAVAIADKLARARRRVGAGAGVAFGAGIHTKVRRAWRAFRTSISCCIHMESR